MRRNNLVFHPIAVSIVSVLFVLSYALWMRWRFPGGDLTNHYVYVLPIIVPFVAFLFDRARLIRDTGLLQWTLEILLVGVSILRMLGHVPFVSGHTLFLSYAIAAPGSRLTRITAVLVMMQVIYLKLFVWHDFITPVTGIFLGTVVALIVRRFSLAASPFGSKMALSTSIK
ncbi:MAG TPA: hypothetical protein VJT71_04700 [Pyrinomonadaceae bacterium]|nr:hypothetical protein [Pyrinomonadaceae bacterium]